ncbi:MAG: hypothetical protein IJ313_11195 [Clostridia bacterium]|nr:hypothetical protein [Clostridia bacterium]
MACAILEGEGIAAQVTTTRAPKRQDDARGTLRVVYASDDGSQLTVSAFVDPIAEGRQENG